MSLSAGCVVGGNLASSRWLRLAACAGIQPWPCERVDRNWADICLRQTIGEIVPGLGKVEQSPADRERPGRYRRGPADLSGSAIGRRNQSLVSRRCGDSAS